MLGGLTLNDRQKESAREVDLKRMDVYHLCDKKGRAFIY